MTVKGDKKLLKEQILALSSIFTKKRLSEKFIPGKTYIPASGSTMETHEIENVVSCALDGWITEGKWALEFERGLKRYTGNRFCTLVNSGSSANLVAITATTQKEFGERAATPGDEFITTAVGFPTTVSGLVQNGITPVFVDMDPRTLTPDVEQIEQAVVQGRTKGIILAHALGSPFNVDAVRDICDEYGLWFIEDCCDALGTKYNNRLVGTQGTISTVSFFPAHHITTGQGGAVFTDSGQVKKVVDSLHSWGRGCWCIPGKDNTCGKRFGYCVGDNVPYDHKYVFDRLGYNLQMTDLQAAIGVAQMKKIDRYEKTRKKNWKALYELFSEYKKYFVLPSSLPGADPSWFGFHLSVRGTAPFTREFMTRYLEDKKIGSRLLFGGNLLEQPGFKGIYHKVFGTLENSSLITRDTFWLGVHPGINNERMDYIKKTVREFMDHARL